MRVSKLRATTAEWSSAYPWHFGGSIPSVGPIVGIDHLSGGAPFGIDPFTWVNEGIAQNPNIVIAGAPGNGKSALVKQILWWLVGAFGCRFVATDVKGEYTPLARALGVPILDLRPGGDTKVNPLEDPQGRLELAHALAALCLERPLLVVERAALSGAVQLLPDRPLVSDLASILREMPTALCDNLAMPREAALDDTKDLRFALLAGMRAVDQLVGNSHGHTLLVNDETWRLAGNRDTVIWLQHSFKLGRQRGQANIIVVHRLAELGGQADGAIGEIASRLVSDADTHILFRQGDQHDATDTVARLGVSTAASTILARLPKHRCLIDIRGQLALVDVMLSPAMLATSDTNGRIREGRDTSALSGFATPAHGSAAKFGVVRALHPVPAHACSVEALIGSKRRGAGELASPTTKDCETGHQ